MDETADTAIETPAAEDDVTLVALTPADMVPAQTELSTWCDRKLAAVQAELTDLEANLELAMSNGWKYQGLTAAVNRTARRLVYYAKLKTAVEAGYVIVPNFPVDVFAVRVSRAKQRVTVSDSTWGGFRAHPELLPAGEGRYVDDHVKYLDESSVETVDGKPKQVKRYVTDDYDVVDFPVQVIKPLIMETTSRAMALKLFDQMGIVRNDVGKDPIIVGQLLDPRGNGRRVTFFVAWWLDTASL